MWYWYALAAAGYLSLGILVVKLTSPRGVRFFLVVSLFLCIPFESAPYSYVTAVLSVVLVVVLIGSSVAPSSATGPSRH